MSEYQFGFQYWLDINLIIIIKSENVTTSQKFLDDACWDIIVESEEVEGKDWPGKKSKNPSRPRHRPAPREDQTEYFRRLSIANRSSTACNHQPYPKTARWRMIQKNWKMTLDRLISWESMAPMDDSKVFFFFLSMEIKAYERAVLRSGGARLQRPKVNFRWRGGAGYASPAQVESERILVVEDWWFNIGSGVGAGEGPRLVLVRISTKGLKGDSMMKFWWCEQDMQSDWDRQFERGKLVASPTDIERWSLVWWDR